MEPFGSAESSSHFSVVILIKLYDVITFLCSLNLSEVGYNYSV